MKNKGGKKYKGIDDTVRQQRREERKEVYLEKRELKRILLGRSHRNEEGRLVASDAVVAINSNGMEDGAVALYFLGIMHRRKHYHCSLSREEFIARADKACANIGNRVALAQTPDMPAAFRRYKLSVPALLFLEWNESEVIVNIVSAKALTGLRSTAALRKAFEEEMGSALTPFSKDEKLSGVEKEAAK